MNQNCREKVAAADQSHLLAFCEELDARQAEDFAAQLEEIDFAAIRELWEGRGHDIDWNDLASRATSPPAIRLDDSAPLIEKDKAVELGEAALRAGQVAAVLVAGGQGSRLGFDKPKGMYPLGPVSGRTLFEILVDRLLAVGKRYGKSIPLYLMTSPATHDETVEYFAENDRLGLAKDDLIIFCQGTMPAVDAETGKLLLAEKHSLALSPDGHGGTLAAMVKHGCLHNAQSRGIKQLYYFQVDNPLAQICDPEFLGYHIASGSELSTQVVAKHDPTEKVGVLVEVDGKSLIIEYSNLPKEAAERRDDTGGLALWAGNTAVHVFDVAFLAREKDRADALPFHHAKKAVSFVNERGEVVEPEKPNAIKFERFIFDLLPHARKTIVMEIDPAEGFAPVKNGPGEARDTPELAQKAMMNLHRKMLREAGASVADDVPVEIAAQFAYNVGELRKHLRPGALISEPTYLSAISD